MTEVATENNALSIRMEQAKKDAGMIGIVITNTKVLNMGIGKAYSMAAKLAVIYSGLALSTMWHTCTHGDPSTMNKFYVSLSAANQASFKRWVVKTIRSVYPEGTKDSELFIGMNKDSFFVRKDTVGIRDKMRQAVETMAKAEDAVTHGMFMSIDPDKVAKPFDDAALGKALAGLLKKAEGESSEVSDVSYRALKDAVKIFNAEAKVAAVN